MTEIPQPEWLTTWRTAVAPQLSLPGLTALRDALRDDDPRLVQGVITRVYVGGEVGGSCAIGFAGWQGDGCSTLSDVHMYFDRVWLQANKACGSTVALRPFLNWFDDQARSIVFPLLLEAVEQSQERSQEDSHANRGPAPTGQGSPALAEAAG